MPSPNAKAGAALLDVTCPTPTSCLAVGESGSGGGSGVTHKAFALRWNGSKWSIVKSPTLPNGKAFTLAGESCPSAKSCFAVGGAEFQAFPGAVVARWSGTTWSAADLGVPSYGSLTAVSCSSPSSCFATGTDIGASAELKTVVMRWNGTRWTRVPSPNFPQGYENTLDDVTCTSATGCLAVGSASLAHQGPFSTLALRWDGKAWSRTRSVDPDPQFNVLAGVSCSTATNCFAVGSSGSATTPAPIERWKGKTWSMSAHPDPTS